MRQKDVLSSFYADSLAQFIRRLPKRSFKGLLFFCPAVGFCRFGHFISKKITDRTNGFPKTPNN